MLRTIFLLILIILPVFCVSCGQSKDREKMNELIHISLYLTETNSPYTPADFSNKIYEYYGNMPEKLAFWMEDYKSAVFGYYRNKVRVEISGIWIDKNQAKVKGMILNTSDKSMVSISLEIDYFCPLSEDGTVIDKPEKFETTLFDYHKLLDPGKSVTFESIERLDSKEFNSFNDKQKKKIIAKAKVTIIQTMDF